MTIYYVAASGGSDSYAGTIAQPFATLAHAVGLVNAGDSIVMRGGTYTLAAMVNITRNGTSGPGIITLANFPGESPIIDGGSLTTAGDSCIKCTNLSYWRIVGLEVKNAPFHCIYLTGACSNVTVERCLTHHAVRLWTSGGGAGVTVDGTGSNITIFNCDSHHNGVWGANASAGDGFDINYTQQTGNVIRGCRAWRNNDDGFDFWNAANILCERNWSWENGYNDSLVMTSGNGTGFKLAGDAAGDGAHTVRYCMAWGNSHNGFDDNSAALPCTLHNNTSYNNTGRTFGMFVNIAHVVRNNLAKTGGSGEFMSASTTHDHNSWNLGLTAVDSDFLSVDFSGASGARLSDGSLPNINFLKPSATSKFLDVGVNVSLPYSGTLPDLGAYERPVTIYVATTGNDSTGNGSSGNPYLTIQKALDIWSPGDTVIVKDGVYQTGRVSDRIGEISRSGTANAWCTIQAENRYGAIIDGNNNAKTYGFVVWANYIKIDGFRIRNFNTAGFWIQGTNAGVQASNIEITHNWVHDIGRVEFTDCGVSGGLVGVFCNGYVHHVLINSNLWHDIGRIPHVACDSNHATTPNYRHDHALYLQGKYHTITNNIFYNMYAGWAIKCDGHFKAMDYPPTDRSHIIENNTFAFPACPHESSGHIRFFANDPPESDSGNTMIHPTNVLIANNLSYHPPDHTDEVGWSSSPGPTFVAALYDGVMNYDGVVCRNNITTAASIIDEVSGGTEITGKVTLANNFVSVATALLANPDAAYNFKLRADSIARGAGNASYAPVLDYAGVTRASPPDIGAYQYVADTSPPDSSITYPPNGGKFTLPITITATATDDVGVDHVEFYADSTLLGTDTTAPYSQAWDPGTWPGGAGSTVTLSVKAYDAAGNYKSSANVSVTVGTKRYIAPTGNDSTGTGAIGAPYATLSKGFSMAVAGDAIIMRGGTYTLNESVYTNLYDKAGTASARITVVNYTGETPILDGSGMTTSYRSGIEFHNCSYITLRGLVIKNSAASGITINETCSDITVEQCICHHNVRIQSSGAGIQISNTALGNLQILNNDCHHSGISEATGQATSTTGGDGIGNSSQSTGNVIRGNRCYRNNDDGIDLWGGGHCLVERNWSMYNGKFDNGNSTTGNGTGFKLGGNQAGEGDHDIRNNLAWGNSHNGYDDNSCAGILRLYNNTGYNNAYSFSFYTNARAHQLKNNLSYPKTNNYLPGNALVQANNGWNLSVTVTTGDFVSTDDTASFGARQSDGSLPASTFLTLVAGSDLIDAGTNVGLAYNGSAPDLGANEWVASGDTTPPTTAITYPASGTFYQSLTITATASDNVGVDHVEFYVNSTLIGTDTTAPYSCVWDPNTWPTNGQVTLTSKAYDAAGNSASSTGVVITVSHWHPSTGALVGQSATVPSVLVASGTHYTLTKYYPTGDRQQQGNWTPSTGTTLFDVVKDSPQPDSDFIQSGLNPVNDICELSFTNVIAPGAGTVHSLSYRIRSDIQCPITVSLVGGNGTTVASWVHSGASAPSDQWTLFDQVLTAQQISDWAAAGYPNSFLRVTAG